MFLKSFSNILKCEACSLDKSKWLYLSTRRFSSASPESEEKHEEKDEELEFRVLQVRPPSKKEEKKKSVNKNNPPRTQKMAVDQDWTSVWPGPRTFHPAVVPLPVRQGSNKKGAPPGKFGNTELMKIPNFLHLTPPAIKKHCEAIKQFCTKWPENLTDEEIEKQFPVEIITSDYCHSAPTIRDKNARIVTLKVKLRSLELDEHARDKFLRLVGARYDPATDVVTITAQNCPRRKQNYDYAYYLLTALYYESWKFEDWEKTKENADMETYIWSKRGSRERIESYFAYNKREVPDTRQYAEAVENLINDVDEVEKEKLPNLDKYKEATLNLLSLPKFNP